MEHSNFRKKHNYKFTLSTLTLSCLMAFNAQAAVDCTPLASWEASKAYNSGEEVKQGNNAYKAKYWTQNNDPATAGEWGAWQDLGSCSGEVVNVAPTATLALSSSSVELGSSVTLTTEASDSDGTIDKVDFYVNNALVGTAATAPYTLQYKTTAAGSLSVYAKATDNLGASTQSASSTLIVTSSLPIADNCRPDGLYQTEGVNVPYCTTYDKEGRELMGTDHPRRVIGYFTSWRDGGDEQNSYLVKDIPWEQLTHINYAFVSIGSDGNVNVGDVTDPNNAATGKEWAGVEIDPTLGFKGHFGALATAKEKHGVKTLISIGGWAETDRKSVV